MRYAVMLEKEKEIYFIIGQGANNGKTTLLEAMKDAMPSVVGSMNNQVLLANYQKSHKFLPMLEKKLYMLKNYKKEKNSIHHYSKKYEMENHYLMKLCLEQVGK
jgi:predicted ATPase